MGNVIKHAGTTMPAIFAQAATGDEQNEFTAGVQSGFPVISFRGKVWRIRKAGVEQAFTNANGGAMPDIEGVLVKANHELSKVFYKGNYEEGSGDAPDCWSSNGRKPDPEVPEPQSKTCAACPNNAWGSKTSPTGGKSRACSDVRRVAFVFASDLADNGKEATPFLLRTPPTTLNPLKDYAKGLGSKGLYVHSMLTSLGFDTGASHPKLTFRPLRVLNEDEAEAIVALRNDEITNRIIAESGEFVAAVDTDDEDGTDEGARIEVPSQPAAATSKPKKLQPVDEEAAGEEEEEEEAAPPPPPPAKKKKAAAPPPPPPEDEGEEEEEEEEAAPPPPPPRPVVKKAPVAAAATDPKKITSMLDALLAKKK